MNDAYRNLETASPLLLGRFEKHLKNWLPDPARQPGNLHEAINYSALAGGKHIRPLLIYATGIATGQNLDQLDGIVAHISDGATG